MPALVLLLLVSQSAATPEDVVANYEEAVIEAGDELVKELQRRREAARVAVELKQFEEITQQIYAFQDQATIPDSPAAKPYERRVERAAKVLERDYLQLAAAASRDGDVEAATQLKRQLESFQQSGQLPPGTLKARQKFRESLAEFETGGRKIGTLTEDEQAFSNRGYTWTNVKSTLPLMHHLVVAGGDRSPITLQVTKPGWVYVAISEENREETLLRLQRDGWTPLAGGFAYSTRPPTPMAIDRKRFETGPATIERLNWSGPIPLLP